ncbi:MAG TPA: SIS domain-containing protein, partial [Trueperaceae bacterium]
MTHFEEEIRAQPDILDALLADRAAEETAVALAHRDFRLILSLARGSSDNAVTFFTYLAGRFLGLPVASVPPSLLSVYTSSMQAQDTLCIGVSQSGESSDVLEGLRALAAAGATTIALTNRQESSLAQAAEFPLCTHAGEEQAVAASKTFSSQMMLLARLVASWSGNETLQDALAAVPAAMRELLAAPEAIMHLALRLTHAEGLYVLGRGLSYGPALELALKLKETSYLHAQAYSSAEFQHGPIAAIDTA